MTFLLLGRVGYRDASTPIRRVLLWALAVVWCAIPVDGAEWTVTSIEDNGPGTLRQAVLSANITAGADTVVFDPSLAGHPVVLTGTTITITDDLTITGLGTDATTIRRDDAAPEFRILDIDDGTQQKIVVVIEHLTITNGHAYCLTTDCSLVEGGGIRNAEQLTLYRVAVRGNTAEYRSVLPGCCAAEVRGGGIYSTGPLEIRSSTVADNSAVCGVDYDSYARGGGIFATDVVLLQRSTVSGNAARSGGWVALSTGGGVYGNVTIKSSTLSGNIASAGGVQNGDVDHAMGGGVYGDVQIHNSTIVGNSAVSAGNGVYGSRARGGGIEIPGARFDQTKIVSTILASNTALTGSDAFSSGWDTAAFNLIGDPVDSGITIGIDGNISGDPQLGALANFGGPTNTHTVQPSSPAVDQGDNPLGLATDQRGSQRVVGSSADIGAFEFGAETSPLFLDGFESGDIDAWSSVSEG